MDFNLHDWFEDNFIWIVIFTIIVILTVISIADLVGIF